VVLLSLKDSFGKLNVKVGKITVFRRLVQLTAFLLINYVIIEVVFAINLIAFDPYVRILPILNSPRNSLSRGAGFTEYVFYFIAEGTFPFFILAVFILIILISNRLFCGWICPIGTIQDILAILPYRKKKMNMDTHKTLLNTKYLIVILLLIIFVPLGWSKIMNPAFYNNYKENLGPWAKQDIGFFSLSEFIFVFFPNLMSEIWNSREGDMLKPIFSNGWVAVLLFVYLIIILLAVFYPRFYCRYLCPYGAIAAAISDYSLLKLGRNPVRCVGRVECGICEKVCPKQVRVLDEPFEFFTGKGECDMCMKCKEKCPYKAINLKFV